MSQTITMTVRLGRVLGDFVSANVGDDGSYENVSEYIRDLIRRDKERAEAKAFKRLEAELAHAFAASEVLGTYNISKLADIALVRNLAMEPALEGLQAEAARSLDSQILNQLHLIAKRPVWEDDGLSPSMWTDSLAGMILAERKGDTPEEVTSLTSWTRGPLAVEMDKLPDEEAAARMQVIILSCREDRFSGIEATRLKIEPAPEHASSAA